MPRAFINYESFLILSQAFQLQHHINISFVQWMLKKHPYTQVDLT
jgi:hypothetical protein